MGNGQVGPPRIRAVTFDFWCTLAGGGCLPSRRPATGPGAGDAR